LPVPGADGCDRHPRGAIETESGLIPQSHATAGGNFTTGGAAAASSP
jgi:hypothetical protein